MTDKDIFTDYFRCSIELTERQSFQRVMLPLTFGPNTIFKPDDSIGKEPVLAIYITEAMTDDLVHRVAEMLKEEEYRRRDPQLLKLWMDYKIMLELKR